MRFLILAGWLPRRRTRKCRTSRAVGGLKKGETVETASIDRVLDFIDEGLDAVSVVTDKLRLFDNVR